MVMEFLSLCRIVITILSAPIFNSRTGEMKLFVKVEGDDLKVNSSFSDVFLFIDDALNAGIIQAVAIGNLK